MKKKHTALLLVLVMVISLLTSVVPIYAATSFELRIIADKTEAYSGDTITYTVVAGPVENFQSANFTLVIPEGLTFVEGAVTEGLKDLLGAEEASFTSSTKTFVYGSLGEYTSESDTKLMTFTCKVEAKELTNYEVTLMDDYDFADNNWTSYENINIDTSGSKITVVEKPIPATGVVLNKKELTLKVGTNETLTATVSPDNSTDTISWSSANEEIATVDANGKVNGVAIGTTTITAKVGTVETVCMVTITCAHANTTTHSAVDSTCSVQGNQEYITCDDCNEVVEGSDIPLELDDTNHINVTENTEEIGTCVEPGHGEYSFCNDCKKVISGSDASVSGPHGNYVEKTEEKYLKTTADCLNAAVYYKSCELCGEAHTTETFTSGEALGHDWVEASCTKAKTCKVCKETEGEALGHCYATEWSKGENGHWHECETCGSKVDESGHDFGTKGDICLVCTYERDHVHRLTLVQGVEASCIKGGIKAYYTCSGCEDWFEDATGTVVIADKTTVNVSALGHSYTNYISDNNATCEKDGTKTAKCDRCNSTDTVEETGSAKGHDWTEATCTEAKTCKVCEKVEGEALGHDWVEASCTEAKICKVCKETEGKALGHSYATEWSKGEDGHWHECVTCGNKVDKSEHDFGTEGDTCLVCKYERDHVHRLTLVQGVEVSCIEKGSKAYYTCSGCEDWFEDAFGKIVIADKMSVNISALGHNYINYVSNNDATYEADGTKTAKCERCDVTDTVTDIGSKKEYKQALENASIGVKLEGTFAEDAELTITKVEKDSEIYKKMKDMVEDGYLLWNVWDIMSTQVVSEKVTVTISVGNEYNGRKAIVYHMLNENSIETFNVVVRDGKLSVTVDSFSPFAVAIEELNDTAQDTNTDKAPQTGDNTNLFLWTSIFIALCGSVMLGIGLNKRRNRD